MSVTVVCARYNEDIHWILPIIDNAIIYNKGQNNLNYIPSNKIINCTNLGKERGTYIKHIIDNYNNLTDYIIFLQGNPVRHIYPDNHIQSYKEIYSIINENKDYHFKYISKDMVKVEKTEVLDYCSGIPSLDMYLFPPIPVSTILEYLQLYSQFDWNQYITYYTDLSFMQNKNDALMHWIKYGKNEGRTYFKLQANDNFLLNENNIKFINSLKLLNNTTIMICDITHLIQVYNINDSIRDSIYKLYDTSTFGEMFDNVDYRYGSGSQFIVHKKQILRRPLQFWEKIYSCLQELNPSAGYGLEKLWPIIM